MNLNYIYHVQKEFIYECTYNKPIYNALILTRKNNGTNWWTVIIFIIVFSLGVQKYMVSSFPSEAFTVGFYQHKPVL